MVKAIIDVDDETNHVLNIIKAKYALKDKSQAIQVMAEQYEMVILEPELRPEFVERLKRIEKHKGIRYKSIEELREKIEKCANTKSSRNLKKG